MLPSWDSGTTETLAVAGSSRGVDTVSVSGSVVTLTLVTAVFVAAVQLDQHTLSGHPPRGIRWRRPRCLGGRLRRGLVSPALTRMRRRVVLPMAIPSRSASNSLKCEWLAPSYFVRASRPAPERRGYPYLLEKIRVTRPNQAWAADITYLPMARGFLYLVAIMDWHSRYVVAWRLSNSLEADFCVDAPQGIRITTLSHVGNTTLVVQHH